MATEEGLRIKLGATVDQLRADIAQAKKDLSGFAVSASGVGKSAGAASAGVSSLVKNTNSLSAATSKSSDLINDQTAALNEAQAAVENFIQQSVSDNISDIVGQFKDLTLESAGSGEAFKALATSLIGPAGIAIGLNFVVTAISASIEKYGSLEEAVSALLKPLTAQQILQREIQDEIDSTVKSTQSEITETKRLFDIASKLTAPMQARKEAIHELREQYPQYLKDLSDEQILAGEASEAYTKLVSSLLETAKARAYMNKINKNQENVVELESERSRVQLQLEAAEAAEKAGLGEKVYQEVLKTGASRSYDYIKAKNKLAEIDEKLALAASENAVLQLKANAITADLTDKAGKREAEEQERDAKKIKRIRTIADVLADLQKEMIAINNFNELVGMSSDKLANEKLTALNKAFDDIAKIGGPAAKKALAELAVEINGLNAKIIGNIDPLKGRQDIFSKPKPIEVFQPIDIKLVPNIAAGFQSQLAGQIKTVVNDSKALAKAELASMAADLSSYVNSALQKLISDGIYTVADGLGSAIAGAGFGQMFSKVGALIGGFLQDLGKQLITYGTTLLGFNLAIQNLNPYVALAAGAAAVAAGAYFKQKASQVPSFATGGAIFGSPTLAMIGDNPGREEYIIPSEVLDKLGAGGGYPQEITLRAQGSDLVGVLRMGQQYNGRING